MIRCRVIHYNKYLCGGLTLQLCVYDIITTNLIKESLDKCRVVAKKSGTQNIINTLKNGRYKNLYYPRDPDGLLHTIW